MNSVPKRGLREYLWISSKGFCMGAADVVPGVSGGTMAFILGIYEELIDAIHSVNLVFLRRLLTLRFREAFEGFQWRFLLALGLGLGTAIFTLAKGINWALRHHPEAVWAFFFGLVLASVFVVRKKAERWTVLMFVAAGGATAGAYLLVGLVPVETPNEWWFLMGSGAVAICAMILPGISGAFILVLLGKYQYVLDAVVSRDIITLAIFAGGCAVGILSFVRVLRWLFHRWHDMTVAALTGLMLGSLRKIWPWKDSTDPGLDVNIIPPAMTPEVMTALGLVVLGFVVVLVLEYLASRSAAGNASR